jgi:chaperonin GroES
MKIIQDRLLLQLNDAEAKTDGGLFLTEQSQQKTFKVITTGPGLYNMAGKLVPPPAKEGDNVIIANGGNCGVEITLNGDKYRLIKSDDVLVIL